MNGIRVAVIGTVTQEVPTLVTPAGISELDFGDPVDAINRVAARIKTEQLADVIIVENHDGAGAGTPEGATLEQEVAVAVRVAPRSGKPQDLREHPDPGGRM